jgi:hypothetical protein
MKPSETHQQDRRLPLSTSDLLADLPGMEGVWSSPGAYTIEWQDEDHVKVTKHWRGFDDVAILTGGGFETILETIFTGAVVTRVHSSAND